MMAGDVHPVAVLEAQPFRPAPLHVEPVAAKDLPEPCIHRAPGVVHGHGPLGDRMHREVGGVGHGFLERRVPHRHRIEECLHPAAVNLRRHDITVATGSEPELLHHLGIEVEGDWVGIRIEAEALRPLEVILVGHAVVTNVFRQLVLPVAAILDVLLKLLRIDLALAGLGAVGPAETRERADAGPALVIDNIVGIAAGEFRRHVLLDHARQAQPCAKVEHHRLERSHVAVGLDHRLADRVCRPVRFGDRAVEQRDAVPTLQIGRVGQDQVGIGDHLRIVGIGVDDLRDDIIAGLLVDFCQVIHDSTGIHGRIPAHVGHVHEQHVDAVGVLVGRIGDDRVHQPVCGDGGIPRVGLVDTPRRAVCLDQQVFRPGHEAQRRAGQRFQRVDLAHLASGLQAGRSSLRERWLVEEAAGHIYGAEQDLQDVDRAAGVETVGVGRDATHGVHRHGAASHRLVLRAVAVGPFDGQFERLLEGGMGQFARQPDDRRRLDAAGARGLLGSVVVRQIALCNELEGGYGSTRRLARQLDLAMECRLRHLVDGRDLASGAVVHQHLAKPVTGNQAVIIAALVADD